MPSPDPMDLHIGQRLRERRTVRGMSQERLGDLLGVTFQQIQKYERGSNRIGASRLHQIARILAVPVAWFFDDPSGEGAASSVGGAAVDQAAAGPGFAEAAARFDPEGAPDGDLLAHREVLELVRAYSRITDPLLRRRLAELAKALAAMPLARSSEEGTESPPTPGAGDPGQPPAFSAPS